MGLCFYGTAQINQTGIQSVQGALFTVIAVNPQFFESPICNVTKLLRVCFAQENFFTPMYSAITVFPRRDPLFMRERQAGLYDTFQYYLTTVLALVRSNQITQENRLFFQSTRFVYSTDSRFDCGAHHIHGNFLFFGWTKADILCICNDCSGFRDCHEHFYGLWY